MSHVDDGQLHAYLDGAYPPGDPERIAVEDHLATCADCRGRIEAVRLERDEAAGILGLLEPEHIRTPPFETLLAMRSQEEGTAGGTPVTGPSGASHSSGASGALHASAGSGGSGPSGAGPGGPSRGRRLVPLAWAASLAAAIGGGWMAHGVWSGADGDLRPGAAMESAADVGVGVDEEAAARTTPQVGAAPPPGPDQVGAADRAAAADQVAAATTEAEATALAASEAQARAVADSLRTVSVALRARVDTLEELTTRLLAGAPDTRVPDLPRPAPTTTGILFRTPPVADAAVAADALAAREPPGAPEAEPTAAELAAIAELEAIGQLLGEREAGADLTGAWQPVTPAEAAEALGRVPFDLDELPWDRMELARVEGQALLRTRHPQPDGMPFVLVQVAWPGTGNLLLQERAAVAGKVQGQAIRIPFNVQLRSAEPGAEHTARPRAQSLTLPLRDGIEGLALVLGPGVGAGPGAGPDELRRADTGAAAAADAAAAAAARAAAARGERALAGADGSLSRMAVWIESQGAALLLRGPGGPGGPDSPGELEAVLRRLR